MRRLLSEMKPDRLEDLIAANALFRPGPMDLIPDYNRRKHGQEPCRACTTSSRRTPRDLRRDGLSGTGHADRARAGRHSAARGVHDSSRRSARRSTNEIAGRSARSSSRARAEQGLPKDKAEELFELILKFAGYGFNKSHSTGYAIVAYQTAYLKTYFPPVHGRVPDLREPGPEGQRLDPVPGGLPQDPFDRPAHGPGPRRAWRSSRRMSTCRTRTSPWCTSKDEPRTRRAGTSASGCGPSRAWATRPSRPSSEGDGTSSPQNAGARCGRKPFTSLFDFCERVPRASVNKATVESLDRRRGVRLVHGRVNRAAMLATIEQAVSAGRRSQRTRPRAGAVVRIRVVADAGRARDHQGGTPLARVAPWTEAETLKQEKEKLGFYVSSHPLQQWSNWIGPSPLRASPSLTGPQAGRTRVSSGRSPSRRAR
jgi:DNA polymerase-3 subunit alpha